MTYSSNPLLGIALLLTLLHSLTPLVDGLVLDHPPRPYRTLPVNHIGSTSCTRRPTTATRQPGVFYAKEDSGDESGIPTVSTGIQKADNDFDANGFGGYLAPYALAAAASIVATGAFVKLVLLDY